MSKAGTIYSKDKDFWEKYRKGRPQVPDSFFQRIFDYHASHGGEFGTVHDAGAGGGVHSARLAGRFGKVIVSDVFESNIEAAKSHLSGPKYEFRAMKLEDTINFPAASVDMVFASTMLHFTDVEQALEAVAHQLKPGGTFAVPLLGIPRFSNPQVQNCFTKVFHEGCGQRYGKLKEEDVAKVWINATGYDCVALPERYFQPGGLRIRLNEPLCGSVGGTHYELKMPEYLRLGSAPPCAILDNEQVVYETDNDWVFHTDIAAVEDLLATLPFDLGTINMKHLSTELSEAIGDHEVEGRWVVYLLLATRR